MLFPAFGETSKSDKAFLALKWFKKSASSLNTTGIQFGCRRSTTGSDRYICCTKPVKDPSYVSVEGDLFVISSEVVAVS